MTQISKNVKLLYCHGDKLAVERLRRFVLELDGVEHDDELEVSIASNGQAFTIEGFLEGV